MTTNTQRLEFWRRFWRAVDEARLMPRGMVIAAFVALVAYVFFGTTNYHRFIAGALVQSAAGQATWSELVPVLGAITAFYSITIPVLSKLFLDMWKDYRQSGVDWERIEARAAVGAENMPSTGGGAQS